MKKKRYPSFARFVWDNYELSYIEFKYKLPYEEKKEIEKEYRKIYFKEVKE